MTDFVAEPVDGEIKYITKKCNRCEELKPVEEFHKNSASHDGLRSYCKKCHNESRKEGPKLRPKPIHHEILTYAESPNIHEKRYSQFDAIAFVVAVLIFFLMGRMSK
jgi:hypothetical protein